MDTENRELLGNDLLILTPEESDAEALFDELHWGGSNADGDIGDPAELQKCLHDETDTLFVEICDFLLQWEEDDEADPGNGSPHRNSNEIIASSNSCVRGTFELLSSLDNVDASLENVNDWLNEQVEYLSGVQSQLFQIEAENSGLETSWHNLSAVKAMITSLLHGPLSLKSAHEDTLRHPQQVLQRALHEGGGLENTSEIITPLVEAISSLRLGLENIEGVKCDFTPAQWRQIQAMTAISEHKQKLHQLSSDVCAGLLSFSQSVFKTLVQHKALSDEKVGGKPVRRFSFTSVVNSVKVIQGNYKVLSEEQEQEQVKGGLEESVLRVSQDSQIGSKNDLTSAYENPPDGTSTTNDAPNVPYSSFQLPEPGDEVVNQIAQAQGAYHRAVYPFYLLMENMSELSPTLQDNLCESYVTYTEKYLFSPLFKGVFRDMIELLPSHQSKDILLSSMSKCLARKMSTPALLFQHPSICRSGSPLVLSPWTLFSAVVRLADEVIHAEQLFLSRVMIRCTDNVPVAIF